MSLTTDPNDPRLKAEPVPGRQNNVYLVLSAAERAKGFIRPLRRAYLHVGEKPTHPLRDLTEEERERYSQYGYVKFEAYSEPDSSVTGRFWTQAQLDGPACGGVETRMGLELCETYARDPKFYGSTYCCGCCKHFAVAEFTWVEDGALVGS